MARSASAAIRTGLAVTLAFGAFAGVMRNGLAGTVVVDPASTSRNGSGDGRRIVVPDLESAFVYLREGDTLRIHTGGQWRTLHALGSAGPLAGRAPRGGAGTSSGPGFLLAGALIVGFGALVILAVMRWVLPSRRRRPLVAAVRIIDEDDYGSFDDAEQLLRRALVAGLMPREIADAQFALAYVRARRGRLQEASGVISELLADGASDRETIYLALWIDGKLRNHDAVDEAYQSHRELLNGFLQADRIAGVSYLHQARVHLSRRDAGEAIRYFQMVRDLKVFEDRIPRHLDNDRIIFGIIALFEKELERAREHFAEAAAIAEKDGRDGFHGRLGLLVCDWLAQDGDAIDEPLGRIIETLPTEAEDPLDSAEAGLLMRNVLLWHAVALIVAWQRRLPNSGLSAADRDELARRLERVRQVDPLVSDADLLAGLVGYYFSENDDSARRESLASLARAIELGVSLPEVLNLIDRENRVERFRQNTLRVLYGLLRGYLNDGSVPSRLREALREDLRRYTDSFPKFRALNDPDADTRLQARAPTLEDILMRGQLLHRRVEVLQRLRPRGEGATDQGIADRLDALSKATEAISSEVETTESLQFELMRAVGLAILAEEAPLAAEEEGAT